MHTFKSSHVFIDERDYAPNFGAQAAHEFQSLLRNAANNDLAMNLRTIDMRESMQARVSMLIALWWQTASMQIGARREEAFECVTEEIAFAASMAFQNGGMAAVRELQRRIHAHLDWIGGPVLVPGSRCDSIDVHHVLNVSSVLPASRPAGSFQTNFDGCKQWFVDIGAPRLNITLAG